MTPVYLLSTKILEISSQFPDYLIFLIASVKNTRGLQICLTTKAFVSARSIITKYTDTKHAKMIFNRSCTHFLLRYSNELLN